MKTITKFIAAMMLIMWSVSSQAMTVWAVQSGQGPFSNSQGALALSAGTNTLDLYYDVGGDVSYGYDFILDVTGTGSIANVGGGDSGLGSTYGSGWRQLGGSLYGETGSSVLAFSFDFIAAAGASLIFSGSYTDSNFLDATVPSSTLAAVSESVVSAVPVPAAIWLFGSGFIAFGALAKRRKV